MEQGEAALTAACRELGEELGMKAYRAERLFDYTNEGSSNDHKVVLVFAGGEPKINDRELDSFLWWDGRERLPLYPHVTSIVGRYEAGESPENGGVNHRQRDSGGQRQGGVRRA